MPLDHLKPSRRAVLKGASVFLLAAHIPLISRQVHAQTSSQAPQSTNPNAFVRIDTDGIVTILSKHSEVGQGAFTGMASMIAEEMDADWSQVKAESAPADSTLYANFMLGPWQGTGGSSSVNEAYQQMLMVGATARYMLVQAAAKVWNVPAEEITVSKGKLSHGSGKSGGFGEFAASASQVAMPDPSIIKLKNPSEYQIIGKGLPVINRIDQSDKVNGKAMYTQDLQVPNMQTVVILRPPRFGAKLKSFDDSKTRQIAGVINVKAIETGVAVYAKSTWAAIQGRDKLVAQWDFTQAENRSTDELFKEFIAQSKKEGKVAVSNGNLDQAFNEADSVVEMDYFYPFLAHAPMETLDGFILWDGQKVTTEYGAQIQGLDQKQFAKQFGISEDKVSIKTLYAGGSFGRRIDLGGGIYGGDLVADMCGAAKAAAVNTPIKVIWTREDDIQGGWYRPMMMHRMRAGLSNGKVSAWSDYVIGQSFCKGTAMQNMINPKTGVDQMMVDGSSEIPYEIPNFVCKAAIVDCKVPVTSMRSVASTHTCHAVECFMDTLLQKLQLDPVQGRLNMIGSDKRYSGVLQAVANACQWEGPAAGNGRARGVGMQKAFGTYVAQVAEVSLDANGAPKVHKVWCAVDCGRAVNPDVILAQIQGGIAFGLNLALYGAITLDKGHVEQSNFNNYRPLRMSDMPEIELHIVPSDAHPTGIGELGVPPIAPAVANALAQLGWARNGLDLPLVSGVRQPRPKVS